VLFLDEFEGENGADESLLHSVEVNDSRSGTTSMNASAMMPSPILLWRFKVSFSARFVLGFRKILEVSCYFSYNVFVAFF
jgi:hypothetical protein